MSHWNANGLVERISIGRRIKRKEEMEESDVIEKVSKKLVKESKDHLTTEENKRLITVTNYMKSSYSSLADNAKKYILEEYIYLSIKSAYKNAKELNEFPYYRVIVSDEQDSNFLSCHITIYIYKTEQHYETGNHNSTINVDIRELFKNCSSVVISKLNTEIYSRGYYDDRCKIENTNFISSYMKVLESICDICNYTMIMYSASLQETNKFVLDHLKEHYKNTLQFNNKRGGNTIIYYTKQL